MSEKLKVAIRNLNVHYGNKQALFDVNLNIMEKEVTSLIGPSGCGKSTLGRAIIFLDPPSSGKIIYNGKLLTKKDFSYYNNLRKDETNKTTYRYNDALLLLPLCITACF